MTNRTIDEPRRSSKLRVISSITFLPITEELLFRWLPLHYAGLPAMILFSVVWFLAHDFDAVDWKSLAVGGSLFGFLWLIDLGYLAIMLHYLYNIYVVCYNLVRDSDGFYITKE